MKRCRPGCMRFARSSAAMAGSADVTRAFEVVRPAAPATRLANTTAVAAPRFLPVDPARLARPFNRAQLLDPSDLQPFRDSSARQRERSSTRVSRSTSGEYRDAAATFRRAVRPDADPTAPMAYLAATYALLATMPRPPTSGAPRCWPAAMAPNPCLASRCLMRRKAFAKRKRSSRMPSSAGRRTGASSGSWRSCMACRVGGARLRTF